MHGLDAPQESNCGRTELAAAVDKLDSSTDGGSGGVRFARSLHAPLTLVIAGVFFLACAHEVPVNRGCLAMNLGPKHGEKRIHHVLASALQHERAVKISMYDIACVEFKFAETIVPLLVESGLLTADMGRAVLSPTPALPVVHARCHDMACEWRLGATFVSGATGISGVVLDIDSSGACVTI